MYSPSRNEPSQDQPTGRKRKRPPVDSPQAVAAQRTELHQAIQEARATLAALQQAVKDARAQAAALAPAMVTEALEVQIKKEFDRFNTVMSTSINNATEAVDRRFQQLTDIMLGVDPDSVRKGNPPVADLLRARHDRVPLTPGQMLRVEAFVSEPAFTLPVTVNLDAPEPDPGE
jgi:predicted component of type VI protein secretion system